MKTSESLRSRWSMVPLALPAGLKSHVLLLIPLALTQLLQRLEHVADNRFIGRLGIQALAVHSIQYNFFLIGQAIGLASATSALIFWRRQESANRQGSLLKTHVLFSAGLAGIIAATLYLLVPWVCDYFSIPSELHNAAHSYLRIGLLNMVFQAAYAPLNAMLVAADRRKHSLFLIACILTSKIVLASFALHFIWSGGSKGEDLGAPMLWIAGGTTVILLVAGVAAWMAVASFVDGWKAFELRQIAPVWGSELGIAMIRSISPLVYCLQIAKAQASAGFFITYQMALHLAYILTLPLLSGIQIAVRDASAEQSLRREEGAVWNSKWWPSFFYASFAPTFLLLGLGSVCAVPMFDLLYGYNIPVDHRPFLSLYFVACMIGQVGNVFLIRLRAAKKNWMATRNFLIAEFGLQLGLTQVLLSSGKATPSLLALAVIAYCAGYLMLNRYSVRSLIANEVVS